MYTAYVKSSTGAGSSSSSSSSSSGAAAEWMAWDARVARDVLHEEELARKVTKDYHHANGGAAIWLFVLMQEVLVPHLS